MENKRSTLEEKFLSDLRGSKDQKLFIYWNLFSILHLGDPDFLEHIVDEYRRAPEDSWWFINFHKALRQCDYFSNSLCLSESSITDDEAKRMGQILFLRSRIRRENNMEDTDITDPEYIKLGEELRILRTKQNSHERTSIAGHLDSILYECISGGEDELFDFMREFLKANVGFDQMEPNA
jgi:hypothetical protein